MRACVSAAVYEKSLRVSSRSSAKFTAGEVTNLMTADAIMFHEMMSFVDVLYSGPLQLCLAAYFLNDLVGWEAALAGLSMIFICVPVSNVYYSFRFETVEPDSSCLCFTGKLDIWKNHTHTAD